MFWDRVFGGGGPGGITRSTGRERSGSGFSDGAGRTYRTVVVKSLRRPAGMASHAGPYACRRAF